MNVLNEFTDTLRDTLRHGDPAGHYRALRKTLKARKRGEPRIELYPGVPRLGTPEFEAWLERWHSANGAK
jgi:hypothetical protein